MIDRNLARSVFAEYTKQFNQENKLIINKINHCYRVADLCANIADSFFYPREEIELLYVIGLLHDIGHFEIIERYGMKTDAVDHADHALKVLFDNKLMRKIDKTGRFDSLIQTSIFAHNKVVVPEKYDEKAKEYARILRDADKLDIFLEVVNKEIEISVTSHNVTPEVWELFKEYKPIPNEMMKTSADHLIKVIAYLYDINYKYSVYIIEAQKYIELILNHYRNQDPRLEVLLNLILDITTKYMKKRIEEYAR